MMNDRMRSLSIVAAFCLLACGWDTYEVVPITDSTGGAGGSGAEGGTGGGVGGGGAGGGGFTAPCGRADMWSETFDDEVSDALWQATANNSSTIVGATGSITFTVQTSEYSSADLISEHFHDFRDSSVAIEVSDGTLASPASATFWLGVDASNRVMFVQQADVLRARYELEGVERELFNVAYDPVAHRWWRFREAGAVTLWEVSPDNTTYTAVGEWPTVGLFPMDRVRLRIQAHVNGTAPATPQTLVVDTIAVEGEGSGTWCPIATLSDDFADGFRSRDWLFAGGNSGTSALETEGRLVFSLLSGVVSNHQYVSSQNYDLTDGEVVVELPEHGGEGTTSYLELTRQSQAVAFSVTEVDDGMGTLTTMVQASTNVDGNVEIRGAQPYDPNGHRFLRIRHDGVGLVWETSADGVSWPESASDERSIATVSPTPPGLIIDDLDVRIGSRGADMSTPGHAQFDNLNLPPSP